MAVLAAVAVFAVLAVTELAGVDVGEGLAKVIIDVLRAVGVPVAVVAPIVAHVLISVDVLIIGAVRCRHGCPASSPWPCGLLVAAAMDALPRRRGPVDSIVATVGSGGQVRETSAIGPFSPLSVRVAFCGLHLGSHCTFLGGDGCSDLAL